MRAEHTRYEAPGWGVGELWSTPAGVLLAHEIEFGARAVAHVAPAAAAEREASDLDARTSAVARPPKGAASPPTGTVTAIRSRVGNGSAPKVRQLEPASEDDHAARFVSLARASLAGEDVSFHDVEIDLSWATPFQLAVAAAIRAIPRGEVAAYGELAALAGYPGAGRAVGTFCARNRFMLVLPCHRVVGAGGIGGYGSAGVGVKRRLLALEGVRL